MATFENQPLGRYTRTMPRIGDVAPGHPVTSAALRRSSFKGRFGGAGVLEAP